MRSKYSCLKFMGQVNRVCRYLNSGYCIAVYIGASVVYKAGGEGGGGCGVVVVGPGGPFFRKINTFT